MGCISSTKKLHSSKGSNFYKVSLVGLQPDLPSMPRYGILELRPLELVFTTTGREPFKWAIQHLRRYGLNGNVFSFETGRRCVMGPRIYMFRCCNADVLYYKFQRYVNSITAERNRHGQIMEAFEAIARNEYNTKGNHYLQSTSAPQANGHLHHSVVINQNVTAAVMHSTEGESTSTVINSLVAASEREHCQSESSAHLYTNINLSKDWLTTNNETNNNLNCIQNSDTKNDLNLVKNINSEKDFAISPIINIHFCHNNNETSLTQMNGYLEEYEKEGEASTKHLYENLMVNKSTQYQQRCSSHSDLLLLSSNSHPTINYIVLDLHKSVESTPQNEAYHPSNENMEKFSTIKEQFQAEMTKGILPSCNILNTARSDSELSEACRGYSSIDFVKTCALNKSSGNCIEFEIEHDSDEFRVTRHSKSLIYNSKYNINSK